MALRIFNLVLGIINALVSLLSKVEVALQNDIVSDREAIFELEEKVKKAQADKKAASTLKDRLQGALK